MTIQEQFKIAVDRYIKAFEKKQGYEFTDWVGESFQIAVFIDHYFIDFGDVRYDIDNKCPKGLIFQYQDDLLEMYTSGGEINKINYPSYAKGLRFEISQNKAI